MIANAGQGVSVTGNADADAFLRGSADGLLYAALFDQQMRAELAFIGAFRLHERLGHLDADRIAAMAPADLADVFREKPGIHRFGQMMAQRAQRLAAHVARESGGSVAAMWADAPSDDALIRRLAALPGFGPSKAGVLLEALELFGHRALSNR
jgi:uncharacterized HhH-GPD family protein